MKLYNRERYYSVADIATMLGRSVGKVWWAIHEQKLMPQPLVKIGRRMYYSEAEFNQIVAANEKTK